MQIDQLLPPSKEFIESYKHYVNLGKDYCQNIDIVFSCLARNIGGVLFDNLSFLFSLETNIFRNVDIVILENDSSDNTKDVLNIAKKLYKDKLHIFSEDNGGKFFSSAMPINIARSNERTMAMADYRNRCKEYISNNLKNKDYTIVLDLDFLQISINGLFNSFGIMSSDSSVKAMAGNAYELKHIFTTESKHLWNYDSWAFRQNWWIDKATEVNWYDPMLWFGFWTPAPGLPIMRVNSAFGGMAIYRMKEYLSANYDGYDCEHVCFHKNLYNNNPDFGLYLNPSQVILL